MESSAHWQRGDYRILAISPGKSMSSDFSKTTLITFRSYTLIIGGQITLNITHILNHSILLSIDCFSLLKLLHCVVYCIKPTPIAMLFTPSTSTFSVHHLYCTTFVALFLFLSLLCHHLHLPYLKQRIHTKKVMKSIFLSMLMNWSFLKWWFGFAFWNTYRL